MTRYRVDNLLCDKDTIIDKVTNILFDCMNLHQRALKELGAKTTKYFKSNIVSYSIKQNANMTLYDYNLNGSTSLEHFS